MAEQIRRILVQEQDHQIDLATALGIKVPNVSDDPESRASIPPLESPAGIMACPLWVKSDIAGCLGDVRFTPKADMCSAQADVR